MNDITRLLPALGLDLLCVTILTAGVYRKIHRNHEYILTYVMFNVVTFTMGALLKRVPMEIGFALGLFAVFGVLRYRTESIRIIDLTYLFVAIGIAMLNGIAGGQVSFVELAAANGLIVGLTAVLELGAGRRVMRWVPVFYDNLDLLRAEQRDALFADIQARTGLHVHDVAVDRVDMLREAAELRVQCRASAAPSPAGEPALSPLPASAR